MTEAVATRRHHDRFAGMAGQALTPREVQVVRLVAAGQTNMAIATVLYDSENAVKWILREIQAKLGAVNRASIVNRAYQTGILTVPQEPGSP